MMRKLLIAVLVIALLIELALTGGAFFATEVTMAKFGVTLNAETAFLSYIIAWFLLFTSAICLFATWQVWKNKNYHTLCYLLGFWWIGIGIGIYVAFKKPDNLFLDSLKGLLIVLFAKFSRPNKSQQKKAP
ncbi:MAG: hypothetical protein ABJA37_08300 [Ferruginibacter sp.]